MRTFDWRENPSPSCYVLLLLGRVQVFYNSTVYLLFLLHFFLIFLYVSCDFVLILFMELSGGQNEKKNRWMSGLEFLLCAEKQEGPRRTQKEHEQWVCRVSSSSWEVRFESASWKFRHEATRGDVLGVGRKFFSNIPGVAFSVRKQFFVSTPQETKNML